MPEETRELMVRRLKEALDKLPTLLPGSKEREALVREIDILTRQINEDMKIRQVAWDAEESRKIDEEIRKESLRIDEEVKKESLRIDETIRTKQTQNERFRSEMDLAKGVGTALVTAAGGFAGMAVGFKWMQRFNVEGFPVNRELAKMIPKVKFW